MGKCFSRIKDKPALQSATENRAKSRGWKKKVKKSLCMGKHSAVVEPCVIHETVTESEYELKHSAEPCVIHETVTKSEFELKHSAEPCVIHETVTKSEYELKHSAEPCVISETFTKSEYELKHSAEPCVIHETVTKSEYELKHSAEPCVISETVTKSESEHSQCTSDEETSETSTNSGRVTPISPCSSRIKKVSFADHKGFALTTFRFITEPSDEPPGIAADVNKSITKVAETVAPCLPSYKLEFSQPAANYMAFRKKVERCNVSLENVILRDYNVLGTIKVKNICFEKRVFVRVTFDSWVTSQDVEAKYVQPYVGTSVHDFDTFSFEFEIDTHSDTNKKIQLAVCFETPTGQHWDNNSGENYEIIPYENVSF